ncbi:MAG: protein-export membrane protein SecD [Gammaproteobacteria bacterium RIFCSPHIGHO2_12_FULL_45_9]|nr:MAG: protein-export membrane protein SecD [Gammaproteobacteria bacterium RIFCSPHIGHO2_12_FULL_45_9]
MNRYSLWRYIVLVGLIILGIVYALPNVFGEDPAIQITGKNGVSVSEKTLHDIQGLMQTHHIAVRGYTYNPQGILVRFPTTDVQLTAQDWIQALLGTDYSVALNLAPRTPHFLVALGAQPMKLGLDLRGGIHFLLAVDVQSVVSSLYNNDLHTMGDALRHAHIRYVNIALVAQPTTHLAFAFRDEAGVEAARTLLQNQFPDYQFTSAGFSLQAALTSAAILRLENDAVEQNLTILRARVNELGVAEPVIQRQGSDHISVDLPGIQDTARAKDMIGKVASLRWMLVDTEQDAVAAASTEHAPAGDHLYRYEGAPVLLKEPPILLGRSITGAATMMGEDGRPAVSVQVSGAAVSAFNRITGDNIGKPLAVVYVETVAEKKVQNGHVETVHRQLERIINIATIQSALGNRFEITGLGSEEYAQNLALLLRSGAYSAPVDFIQERVVGPSLGQENIRLGVRSVEVGALFVIVFMCLYYRVFGLIADLALLLNLVFIVAILSVLGATLTLPAIAGIVLTVGMAVDANVLINERIREELRNGASPQASIQAGYDRAFATIVDANVSTLIVALVLLAFMSGSVENFAVTLIIGLLCSMMTAIFFTRAVVNLTYGGRRAIKRLSIGLG